MHGTSPFEMLKTPQASFRSAELSSLSYKVVYVFLSSMALFFFFFAYDTPSPIYPGLEATFGREGYSYKHSLLYSVYALPNLFIPVVVANASRNPSTKMLISLYALIAAGHGVFCVGASLQRFSLLLLGRFVIGLGGETFSVVQNKILVMLFQPSEHGFAMGISLAIARLGTIFAYLFLGDLMEFTGIAACSLVGFGFLCLGLVFCWILHLKKPKRAQEEHGEQTRGQWMSIPQQVEDSSPALVEVSRTRVPVSGVAGMEGGQKYHFLFPYILTLSFLFSAATSPFSSTSTNIYQQRLEGTTASQSSVLLALQEIIALFLTPTVGYVTDLKGHKLSCILAGTVLLISGHVLILGKTSYKYLPPVLLGCASPFISCYWPCVPVLLASSFVTLGFSVLSCTINFAYTLCPAAISFLTRDDKAYTGSEIYTTAVAAAALAMVIYIMFLDRSRGVGLNKQF